MLTSSLIILLSVTFDLSQWMLLWGSQTAAIYFWLFFPPLVEHLHPLVTCAALSCPLRTLHPLTEFSASWTLFNAFSKRCRDRVQKKRKGRVSAEKCIQMCRKLQDCDFMLLPAVSFLCSPAHFILDDKFNSPHHGPFNHSFSCFLLFFAVSLNQS